MGRQGDIVLPIPRTLETQGLPSLDLVISPDCPSENEVSHKSWGALGRKY